MIQVEGIFAGGGGSDITAPIIGKDFNWSGGDGTYQVLEDGDGNWRIKFLSSGTFTPLRDMVIDVFCVGGGGGAGAGAAGKCGGGGGGGYTKTSKSIVLIANTEYPIVIGAGGYGYPGTNVYVGTDGGSSSGFGVTANGGKGGSSDDGGDGGSGGGGGINSAYTTTTQTPTTAAGGSDGSNGYAYCYSSNATVGEYGLGQGTTTREFGEETGDLYAGGGGGMVIGVNSATDYSQLNYGGAGGGGKGKVSTSSITNDPYDGEPNTGGGGGGTNNSSSVNSGNGGSGIVIIRKHKEAAA